MQLKPNFMWHSIYIECFNNEGGYIFQMSQEGRGVKNLENQNSKSTLPSPFRTLIIDDTSLTVYPLI